jgi:hypothetical protein
MAVTNAFSDAIKKFAIKADERANLVTRKIIFDVSTALVLKSPVGDPKYWKRPAPPGYVGGRFRANWQYGQGSINRTTTENIDKSGGPTIQRIVGSVGERVLGEVHFITNSLPYANRLEDGWSWRQAPNGMVQVTILEFDPIVRAAAAEYAR